MWKRRLVLICVVLSLFLTGCSIDNIKKIFVKEEEKVISNLSKEALIFDGQTSYNKTIELISSAQKAIFIEQSVFSNDNIKELVLQKAKSGVEVRILLDQFITANRSTVNDLKANNVSVQYYPAQKGQANDVKFMVVDYTQALVYSYPWTDNGFNSHSLTVALKDNSAWELAKFFNRDWQFTTTLSLDLPDDPGYPSDNIIFARNAYVKQQLTDNIAKSEHTVWAMVSEVTEQDLVQSLIDAANKGLDVRLIISPTIMPEHWPDTLQRVKSAGVQVRYFKHPQNKTLGLNLGIFDGERFILSSSSWSYASAVMDHELSLTIPSPVATEALIQQFDNAWQNSLESL